MTSTEPSGERARPAVRPTRQRRAVAAALDAAEEFRSAQQIHEWLHDQGDPVGLATVYRTLQLMADLDEVDVLRGPTGDVAYRRCSGSHHHHLVCRDCGATVEVDAPAVERWTASVAAEHGFAEVAHTLEIVGVCRDCGRRKAEGPAHT